MEKDVHAMETFFHTVEVPDFSLPLQNSRPARALWPPRPAQSGYPRSASKEQSKMSVLEIIATLLYLVLRFKTFLNFLFLQPLRGFRWTAPRSATAHLLQNGA
jgi:hypothetical protein